MHDSPVRPKGSAGLFGHPMALVHLIRGSSMILLFTGLIMVLSSSYVESKLTYGSEFEIFLKQALYAGLGAIALVVVSTWSIKKLQQFAPLMMLIVLGLLLVVFIPGLGDEVGGQRNWIDFGGIFRIQPSEFAKMSLVLWGATLLSKRNKHEHNFKAHTGPLLIGTAITLALILAAGDLGNVIIIALTVGAMLFAANLPIKYFGYAALAGTAMVAVLAYLKPYRVQRITSWLNPELDPLGSGYQAMHAKYALASGGLFGQNIGGSKEKWGTLPEAHTDFIFAIIGEELGLLGAFTVLLLFTAFCISLLVLARRTDSDFIRYASAGAFGWIGSQAFINIGAVLGVLPIMGVPLPLVSAGGSSLIPTLATIGMLISFARLEMSSAKNSATLNR